MAEMEGSPNPTSMNPKNETTGTVGKVPKKTSPHSYKLTPTDTQNFMDAFPRLVQEILSETAFIKSQQVQDWLETVLNYNVPYGTFGRGRLFLATYKYYTHEQEEEIPPRIFALAWCLEFLQTFGLVTDDVVDEATLRRGKPCWYLYQDIGRWSFVDAVFIHEVIFILLDKHFQGQSSYQQLMDIIHESCFRAVIGINLENQTSEERNFESYTRERQVAIAKSKTAHVVGTPVIIGMIVTGKLDTSVQADLEKVSLDIVNYFQIMDDYLDCYREVAMDKDTDVDIANASCSWPIVAALELASGDQRQILKENFGFKDPDKIARVKAVYEDLDLPKVYVLEQAQRCKDIQRAINQLPDSLPKPILHDLLLKYHSKISRK